MGALDPKHVLEVDADFAARQMQDAFDYDPAVEPNPDPMPRMFTSCQELHPGVCKDHAAYAHVLKIASHFQHHIEQIDAQACSLIKMTFSLIPPDGVPSSSRPPCTEPMWLLLGCISKRPLCHVFGKMIAHRTERNVVTPHVEDDRWQLDTLFAIAQKAAKSLRGDAADLHLECSSHAYQAVGSFPAPNHFRVGEMLAEFRFGMREPVPAKVRSRAQGAVSLPFGIQWNPAGAVKRAKAKAKSGTAKGGKSRKATKAAEAADMLEQGPEEEAPQEDHLDDCEGYEPDFDWEASVGEDFASLFRNMHDPDPLAPEHLASTVPEQISVARCLAGQALDLESQAADPVEPSQPSQLPAEAPKQKAPRFNAKVGLVGLATVKRRSKCVGCGQDMVKGDQKFEYVTSLSKPARSLHHECVGQILPSMAAQSIAWLTEQLDPTQPTSPWMSKIFSDALERVKQVQELEVAH